MSHAEFVRWMAFAGRESIGGERLDMLNAMQMVLTASINRRKGKKPPKLSAFMPDWWDERRRPAALAAKFRALTSQAPPRGKAAERRGDRPRDAGSETGG